MREITHCTAPYRITTRRQIIASAAMAVGGLTAGAGLRAQAPQDSMKQLPSTPANDTRTALHQEVVLKATPQRTYEAIMDSKQFTAFTGLPADIDPKVGGAFTMFGGMIEGRNVELTPSTRIVQAWRPAHWQPGVYSIVRFDFKPQAYGSRLSSNTTVSPPATTTIYIPAGPSTISSHSKNTSPNRPSSARPR